MARLVSDRQEKGDHMFNFDTYKLEPGVYFVSLKLEGTNQTLLRSIKIIRNK